jgi:segregation and condensation protein B
MSQPEQEDPAEHRLTTANAKQVLEAALIVAHSPLTMRDMIRLFHGAVGPDTLHLVLEDIASDYEPKGFELVCVEAGWRVQCRQTMLTYLDRSKNERVPKYSSAAMETLATIAYRQPVTRTDIEEARGVSVSSQVLQQFVERDWIEIIGHREGPGRPALYATTRKFLEDLKLESLSDLPIPADARLSASIEDHEKPAPVDLQPEIDFAPQSE